LYGSQIYSLILREEYRLRLFENRGLRRTFWSKGDEVAGEWRKIQIEEHGDMYSSPNILRVMNSRRKLGQVM
jgi:hypothetical protein